MENIQVIFNDEIPSNLFIYKEYDVKVFGFSSISYEEGLENLKKEIKELGANACINTYPNSNSKGFSFEGQPVFFKDIKTKEKENSNLFSKNFIFAFISWIIINSINYLFNVGQMIFVFVLTSVILAGSLFYKEIKNDFLNKFQFLLKKF